METKIETSQKTYLLSTKPSKKRNWVHILMVFVAVFCAGLFWGSLRAAEIRTPGNRRQSKQ